jgi:hypothetical protein
MPKKNKKGKGGGEDYDLPDLPDVRVFFQTLMAASRRRR